MKRCVRSPDREWLHPENFGDEPICCDAPEGPDDVVYHGSDDEAYASPAERRIRCETQAQRFLEGKPVFLLSASLRGAFDRKSGWENPWRSKSTSRVKSVRTKKPSAARRAVERIESSGILDSSSFRQETPETRPTLPRVTYTPPRYLDGDAFHRVRNWRDTVVAESDVPSSSVQHLSQPEPTSADSRRATQQTDRRQSGLTLDTFGHGPTSSALSTPSVVDNVGNGGTSGKSRQKDGRAPNLSAEAGPVVDSNQAPAGQNCPTSSLSPPPTDLLDPAGLFPRPVKIYEQLTPSAEMDRRPDTNQTAAETASSKGTPVGSLKAPALNEQWEERNATPSGIIEATASPALLKTHASSRTDGSFRYRPEGARGKRSSVGRSKLAGSPVAPSDTAERHGSGQRPSLERALEDNEALELDTSPVGAPTTGPEAVAEDDKVSAEVQEQEGKLGEAPQLEASQRTHEPNQQAPDQNQSHIEEDDAETASQIDGPTLVPSESPYSSEHLSMPSFGHFSAEKYSQDVISEAIGVPRKLLWPKSRRSASRDSLPLFGLESARTPASTQSGPSLERSRPVSRNLSTPPEEYVYHPTENEAVHEPAEDLNGSPQEDPSAIAEVVEDDAAPATEIAAGSEAASEAEDEDMPGTEPPQVKEQAEGFGGDADNHMRPASPCPAPQIQSPWAKDDAALRPRSHNPQPQHENIGPEDTQSTPPKTTQSSWAKTADVVPGASGIPAQVPHSHPANAKLPFMASQALEKAVSQSPWARGDSQMQLPEVRLFNPLSSPANSHVLPTTNPAPHSPVPRDDDVDMNMCDSQLYPLPPSTPETKQSGLPTPDFTLSVKSFKNFMTPSPQPAAKRRRISTATDDPLPSTQALVDAAISNPWTRPSTTKPNKHKPKRRRSQQQQQPRPQKRVSWAPLPDEEEEEPERTTTTSSPFGAELPTALPANKRRPRNEPTPHRPHRRRATSPPPSILSTSNLVTAATQKFAKHFAAVASRRVGTTPLLQQTSRGTNKSKGVVLAATTGLLPSASQQVCASPMVGAMAEAFLRAEASRVRSGGDGAGAGDEEEGEGEGEEEDDVAGGEGSVMMPLEFEKGVGMDADLDLGGPGGSEGEEDEEDVEDELDREEEAQETQEEDMLVDEVSAVMENLDDFLGGNWDLDADLAKARTEQARESWGCEDMGGAEGRLSGLMDVGVWD